MGTDNQSSLISKQGTNKIASQITEMLVGLRFGSIEITIHDNKVVQIERREKIRPDAAKS